MEQPCKQLNASVANLVTQTYREPLVGLHYCSEHVVELSGHV